LKRKNHPHTQQQQQQQRSRKKEKEKKTEGGRVFYLLRERTNERRRNTFDRKMRDTITMNPESNGWFFHILLIFLSNFYTYPPVEIT
jgi:hypothetical protein